jgi:hypothetical protein
VVQSTSLEFQERLQQVSLALKQQIVQIIRLFRPQIQIYYQNGSKVGITGLLIKMDGMLTHVTITVHQPTVR